jgi:outer membrane protein OmpA-like peptidoglycan-associated protein
MNQALKLLAGLAAIVALGVAAFYADWLPGSAPSAQERLRARIAGELAGPETAWARFHIDGQKLIVSGVAPSGEARDTLLTRIDAAGLAGSYAFGAITAVDASGVTLAPPAPPVAMREAETAATLEPEPPAPEDAPSASVEAGTAQTADPGPAREPDLADAGVETPPVSAPAPDDTCLTELQTAADRRRIGFTSARAEIDAPSREQLTEIAGVLMRCPDVRLAVTGHTDSSGSASRNRQLSAYRADAVRAYLISLGVGADRVSARGAGSSEPLASNATPVGRERNRRIDIEIVSGE